VLCGLLARPYGGWIVAAGFVSVAAVLAVANVLILRSSENIPDPGTTTEVAALMMFAIGAYLPAGDRAIAVALGAGLAVLLQFKGELHGVAHRLSDNDVRAIMQFALVSLVILPVLPDQAYGPYQVLNPREVWLMVVLIVGIGLAGYVANKFLGRGAGLLLTGILGGLVSSTATTASNSRAAKRGLTPAPTAAIVILIASTIVFARLALEVSVVSRPLLAAAGPPLAILFAALGAMAAIAWMLHGRNGAGNRGEEEQSRNPSEIRWALVFALAYAGILFAVAAVRDLFGDRGLYVVAVLSGLTDVDAITLSTSQLVNSDRLPAATGWRVIVLAALSNVAAKAAIVAVLGPRALLFRIAIPFIALILTGMACLAWWTAGS
jgi:uncharacterized membrane protein (DUF4010 family)